MTKKRVGVVLSGCGFLDGAEIHESVLTMLHLDAAGAEIRCAAPRMSQMHVVDHGTGEIVDGESRDVLTEAARIARGKIRPLSELHATDLDALVMPGGFGAAKNLCNFATAGADAQVHAELGRLIQEMRAANKPIGAICISPAALAAALRGSDTAAKLTIGNDHDTAAALEAMGARHQDCSVTDCVIDEANKIVSTPAYMFDARVSEVSQGIQKLVGAVLAMA